MLETTNSPDRRRWLKSAALYSLGTAVTIKALSKIPYPETLKTASTAPPTSEEPLLLETPLPAPEPVQPQKLTYEDFLASFQFRHIHPREVINPHRQTTRGISNTLPPAELWSAMPATLFIADEIRERLGKPLKLITSAYRNPTYNKACGGASGSWHTKNCALDLAYEGGPRAAYHIACDLRDEGLFEGGIGLYSTFIHLDTRGHNRTWRG